MDLISLYHTNRRIFWLVIIATVNSIIAVTLTYLFKDELQAWFDEASRGNIVILYLILTPFVAAGLFSTTLLAVAGGYFLGWFSLVYYIPTYLIATLLCYFIGKTNKQGQLEESLMKIEGASVILENLYKQQWLVIFFLRISPILPFAVINLLMGAIRTPFWMYTSATFVGMMPRTILAIFGGIALFELGKGFSDETPKKYYYILLFFIAISLWFFYRLTQKKPEKSENS